MLFYIHGGGLVMGNRHQYLDDFAQFASTGEAVVVSVEYRLAPEHPAPAQLDDSYAGLEWVVEHAADLGADPGRIVVAGVSAGGGIALGLALAARDRGGPAIAGLVLIAPMLDDRFELPSSRMVKDLPTNCDEVRFMWRSALGDSAGGPGVSPYVVPARADSYAGLPPTYLDVGGSEGFRDEVIDVARRMTLDGVAVDLHLWAGGSHGFCFMAPDAAISQPALAARDAFIVRALRG